MENNWFDSQEFKQLVDNLQLPEEITNSDSFLNLIFATYQAGQQDK